MALALRFPEEGEFRSCSDVLGRLLRPLGADLRSILSAVVDSSRAGVVPFEDEQETPGPAAAIFRWSKSVRDAVPAVADGAVVRIAKLVVATPGASLQFVRELTRSWSVVGSIVTTDQQIQPFKLSDPAAAACMILSKVPDVTAPGNTLVVALPQAVPVQSTWVWVNGLLRHIEAEEIVCLDSQLSTIYEDEFAAQIEPFPVLRMLASSSASARHAPVARALPTPQFTTGVPAALLTHGELRKHSVRVFISIRDVAVAPSDVARSFFPIAAEVGLELPPAFKLANAQSTPLSAEASVLYT